MPQGEHHSHARPPAGDALAAARQLTDAVEGLRDDLDAKFAFLRGYGKTNRHLIVTLAVSLVLDLVLTVAIIVGSVQLAHNKATIGAVHATQVSACQVGNRLRDEQRQLWSHVAAISKPPPALTPAQKRARAKTIAAFLAYVHKVLPDLNCSSLYDLHH